MKKILLLITICLFVFCSCLGSDSTESQCDSFIHFLSKKDSDGMKSLMPEFIISSLGSSLDDQITDAFDWLGDRTIDSYDCLGGGGIQSIRDHQVVLRDRRFTYDPVTLSDGGIWGICFFVYEVYADDRSKEGIAEILIYSDSEEYRIGNFDLISDCP